MRKIRNRKKGFTLVETLISVLILLLLTALTARGISVATKAYVDVVNSANAQLLLSTTISEIRDELSTATDIVIEDDAITYLSSKTGDESIIGEYSGTEYENGSIVITEYVNNSSGSKTRLLVSKEASNKNLFCTYEMVKYNDGLVRFTNLVVKKIGSDESLAKLEEYVLKVG